jgi:hypothetical protein
MSELTQPEREALLAAADKHEAEAKAVMESVKRLNAAGYTIYAKKLSDSVVQIIGFVDAARETARRES